MRSRHAACGRLLASTPRVPRPRYTLVTVRRATSSGVLFGTCTGGGGGACTSRVSGSGADAAAPVPAWASSDDLFGCVRQNRGASGRVRVATPTQMAHSPTSTVGTARAVPLAARARARGVLAPSPEAGPVGGGSSVWLAPSPRPRRRRALRDSPSMAVAQQNSSSHLAGAFGGTASREWRIFRCSIEAPSTVHFQPQHLSWATATGPPTALSTAPRASCYYYQS